jgi:hypothetical protein
MHFSARIILSASFAHRIKGLTGKMIDEMAVETNLPCARPQPSVARPTRRRMIFIRLPGALVPVFAPIYQFRT